MFNEEGDSVMFYEVVANANFLESFFGLLQASIVLKTNLSYVVYFSNKVIPVTLGRCDVLVL